MMKRVWVIILGILNFIACGSLVGVHYYGCVLGWGTPDAFTGGLPILIAAVLALICGILTLIRKSWGWATFGLLSAVVGGVYALIVFYISSFR
jgi:hypothetical protein